MRQIKENENYRERNYGIDLLRSCAILGVLTLHILGHGNILYTTQSTLNFAIVWFFEIIAYPAVNCFVLISGFVGFRYDEYYPSIKNIVSLFFVVCFYSIFLCMLFGVFYPGQISIQDFIDSFFPISSQQYWFFSSYFAMFLVSPCLNFVVHKSDCNMLVHMLIAVLIISLYALVDTDPFNFYNGFCFAWFNILYLLGAIIKKYEIASRISIAKCILLVISSLGITWIIKVLCYVKNIDYVESYIISYCAFGIISAAIGSVCLFAKLKIKVKYEKVVRFFSTSAFSVYLIHDNRYFRKFIISNQFIFVNEMKSVIVPFIIIGCVLALWVICVFIDKVRIILFELLQVEFFCKKIEKCINKWINKCTNKCKDSL